jgi:hypothetical protein
MTVKEPPKIAVIVNPAAHKGTSFRFVSEVETLVDLDGETEGRLALDVSVLPRAFLVGTVS